MRGRRIDPSIAQKGVGEIVLGELVVGVRGGQFARDGDRLSVIFRSACNIPGARAGRAVKDRGEIGVTDHEAAARNRIRRIGGDGLFAERNGTAVGIDRRRETGAGLRVQGLSQLAVGSGQFELHPVIAGQVSQCQKHCLHLLARIFQRADGIGGAVCARQFRIDVALLRAVFAIARAQAGEFAGAGYGGTQHLDGLDPLAFPIENGAHVRLHVDVLQKILRVFGVLGE